jgi:outer membrane lipoprotein-sorting protein
VIRRALPLLLVIALGAAPSPPAAPAGSEPQTADDVLSRAVANRHQLHSYQVSVNITGKVRASFLAVPVAMDGTEYFKAPDKEAMHLNNVPSLAKSFSNTVNTMGTPQTWEATYDIVLKGTAPHRNHTTYVLSGTPKHSGNVKTMTMWVNTKTYAIEAVAFSYVNGSSLGLEFSHHGLSPYHLPTSIAVSARFPGYNGDATIAYGPYQINVAVPDSVFAQQ